MVDLILLHPPAHGRLGQVELPSDLPDAAVVPQAAPDRLLLERLGEPSSLPFAHEHPLAHSRAFFGVHETQARSLNSRATGERLPHPLSHRSLLC